MTNNEKYKDATERAEAFKKWCKTRKCSECELTDCCPVRFLSEESARTAHYPDKGTILLWLDLEAPDEKPLPCPFCGGECHVDGGEKYYGEYWIQCSDSHCDYSSPSKGNSDAAIEEHNRVARIVKETK